MMFRYRRYRVFVVLAAAAVFLLFEFSSSSPKWDSASFHMGGLTTHGGDSKAGEGAQQQPHEGISTPNDNNLLPESKYHQVVPDFPPPEPAKEPAKEQTPPPPPKPEQKPSPDSAQAKQEPDKTEQTKPRPSETEGQRSPINANLGDRPEAQEVIIAEKGKGRWNQDHLPTDVQMEVWTARPDHFPVPTESVRPLPTGAGVKIPKIQTSFKKEASSARDTRLERLKTIKEAFQHAWKGYKTYAWGKDELSPVSGKSRNTFNGWCATMVDSLDTLWILDMKPEFEEAVEHVKKIDFHTSERPDIPLFETTIRYLGGLLGGYDVSEGKYPVLLEKAVQLGDMLMGAFDTPNRFPLTYFYWKGAYTSQAHRAPSRVVLAEIGSLQLEFTRLAQLTGNNTYYDAVARIVDALKDWQEKTTLPGIWPAEIDTSGCNTSHPTYQPPSRSLEDSLVYLNPDDEGTKEKLENLGALAATPARWDGSTPPVAETKVKDAEGKNDETKALGKRQVAKEADPSVKEPAPAPAPNTIVTAKEPIVPIRETPELNAVDRSKDGDKKLMECTAKGLDSAPGGTDKYTLGSTADSAFEYLPKMHLLLNGQVDDYRKMYERAIDMANEYLVFRIMAQDEKRELYAAGELYVSDGTKRFDAQNAHLTCFVGGMFAVGAKVFGRPDDLAVAAKLTDGCVWAYESTVTGVMPEMLHLVACADRKSCAWNETAWHEAIDPDYEFRVRNYEEQMKYYEEQVKENEKARQEKKKGQQAEDKQRADTSRAEVTAAQEDARGTPQGFDPHARVGGADGSKVQKRDEDIAPTATEDAESALWSPTAPLSQQEVVASRIKTDNLKPGMKDISDRRYLLRPEALESVFYMHRITGDAYWRTAGWKMVASVLRSTRTTFGHASVDDVNAATPEFKDEMESFWLAETLKYAYLLFDDEERYSLDEWVLNTEAHLFRRPAARA